MARIGVAQTRVAVYQAVIGDQDARALAGSWSQEPREESLAGVLMEGARVPLPGGVSTLRLTIGTLTCCCFLFQFFHRF